MSGINKRSFQICSALLAVFLPVCALYIDQDLANAFNDRRPQWYFEFNKWITDFGLAQWSVGILVLVFLTVRIAKKLRASWLNFELYTRLQLWLMQFVLAMMASGLAVHVIKNIFGRARPNILPGRDAMHFRPFSFDWDFQSFPSGHSQTVFCTAFALSRLWPPLKWPALVLAAIIALSRVVIHNHFLSDILAGSYVGYFVTAAVFFAIHQRQLNKQTVPGMQVNPREIAKS